MYVPGVWAFDRLVRLQGGSFELFISGNGILNNQKFKMSNAQGVARGMSKFRIDQ